MAVKHSSEGPPKAKSKSATIGKGDMRYWQQAGKLIDDSRTRSLACRIQAQGRREFFPLRTANRATAATKAAEIYRDIVANGWEAALSKHKPELSKPATCATVGELIEANERLSSVRSKTLYVYAQALRRIVSGVMGFSESEGKHDTFNGGNAAWKEKVEAVRLDQLTPGAVTAWKNRFISQAATPAEKASRTVSVNSVLANAKSLLSKKMLPLLSADLTLPSPLFFEGVSREKRPKLRYRSTIDAREILAAAKAELAEDDPEAFKLLLLTLVCGLRRSEADNLLWTQVDFEQAIIVIEHNEVAQLKSDDSAGEIDMDQELCAILRGFKARATGKFVLETPAKGNKGGPSRTSTASYNRYRCDTTQRRLLSWLRGHGVTSKRPIHTLRKEIGSIIASTHGIFAASRYLRHADIQMTSAIYADKKAPITAGLGGLLKDRLESIPFPEVDQASVDEASAHG